MICMNYFEKIGMFSFTTDQNMHMQIMLMNRLYTLNSFSSQLYFNNIIPLDANSIILKKSDHDVLYLLLSVKTTD